MVDLKTRFLRTYANLPLGVRNEIAVVVDNESISWNALKIEVENSTLIGKKALEILDRLNFLAKDEKN
jgi:hypothetical protein